MVLKGIPTLAFKWDVVSGGGGDSEMEDGRDLVE